MSSDDIQAIDALIGEVEEVAEQRAVRLARFRKRTTREVKRAFLADPSTGAVLRTLAMELQRLDAEVIENILEFALWLRATKSAVDPTSKDGPSFDNPDDLARYLDRELA
jgi:hypothetical protein